MQKPVAPPPTASVRPSSVPPHSGTILLVMLMATTSLSQFFRASTNVIAPELIRDLSLTPEMLGFANASFFWALFAIQVPVGLLFDRIGARFTVAALGIFAVAGALLHAVVTSGNGLVLARFLLGLGHGGSFIATIFLVARWYPRQSWTTVMSRVWAGAMIGIGVAGTPLAYATATIGWRQAFVGFAVISAIVAALFLVLVRDRPPGTTEPPREPETLPSALKGFVTILRLPGLMHVLALQTVAYAVLSTILSLWAGTYLHDVHGLTAVERGNVLIAMALGQVAGLLAMGPLDRLLDTRKWVAVMGAAATLAVLAILAIYPAMPTPLAIAFLVLLAAAAAYGPVVVSHARTFYPEHLAGRGVTTANMAQLLGCAILPMMTGLIPSLFPIGPSGYATEAYRWIFAAIAATLCCGLLGYLRARDVPPSQAASTGASRPAINNRPANGTDL